MDQMEEEFKMALDENMVGAFQHMLGYSDEEFAEWKRIGEARGFLHVESGPLVRSSYHAREQVEELRARAVALS